MEVQYDPGFSTCIRHSSRAPYIPAPRAAMRISMSASPNRRVLRSIGVPSLRSAGYGKLRRT